MGCTHARVSGVADGGDATLVRPQSNWNDEHDGPDFALRMLAFGSPWVDQPAALTELVGQTRWRVCRDLTNAHRARLWVTGNYTGAPSSCGYRLQYTADLTGASGWDYLDGVSGPGVTWGSTTDYCTLLSPYVNLVSPAKALVLLRIVGIGGNGIADPLLFSMEAQFQ
jgi:hypothetical protein